MYDLVHLNKYVGFASKTCFVDLSRVYADVHLFDAKFKDWGDHYEAKMRINRNEGVVNFKEIHRGNDDWQVTLG